MPHRAKLTKATALKVAQLTLDGYSKKDIAGRLKISERSVARIRAGHILGRPVDEMMKLPAEIRTYNQAAEYEDEHPPPKVFVSDLDTDALEALKDFNLFCERYEHRALYPHQRQWITHMLKHPFAMVLAPVRHGKTELVSVMLPVWLLAGGGHPPEYYDNPLNPLRNTRIMLVAKSEAQVKKNFLAIEARLTLNRKLLKDFGRFRSPDLPWQQSKGVMLIEGRTREHESGDYSLVIIGAQSAVLGRGADWIICDDPFDTKNCSTPERTQDAILWLRSEVFTRLEPSGHIFVAGARLPIANEPYAQLEDFPADYLTSEDGEEIPPEDTDYPRLFETIVQPAIKDWGTEEVLCPERMGFRELMQRRSLVGGGVFEAMFQQNRTAPGLTLAQREHIYGEGGFPGCLDPDRRLGEAAQVRDPLGNPVMYNRVLSVDPSPTRYTAALLMDIPRVNNNMVYNPVLIDLHREVTPVPELMRLLWEWWQRYSYRFLVLEKNLAHFIIQTPDFQSYNRSTGVRVIHHHTTEHNRGDRVYGMRSLGRDFEHGAIRIPFGDLEGRTKFQILIKEALEEVATDDTIAALWFPKWHLRTLAQDPANLFPGFTNRRHTVPPPRLAKETTKLWH